MVEQILQHSVELARQEKEDAYSCAQAHVHAPQQQRQHEHVELGLAQKGKGTKEQVQGRMNLLHSSDEIETPTGQRVHVIPSLIGETER